MYTQPTRRLKLEADLCLAIAKNEFELSYQPIVSLNNKTIQIVGFEALLRWRLPDNSVISPDEFIPITEDTGLIIAVGEWVIEKSCLQLQKWRLQFPHLKNLYVSVNLSGKQLNEGGNLIGQLDCILAQTGCLGKNLKLEITESVLIENSQHIYPLLAELKSRSIQISLDDFGTGFSSLSYLNRFKVDTLKLDRSFVETMVQEQRSLSIIQSIISLGHQLGMEIVAEGVETQEQYTYLRALECDYFQGYYFSEPLVKEDIETLLKQGLSKGTS